MKQNKNQNIAKLIIALEGTGKLFKASFIALTVSIGLLTNYANCKTLNIVINVPSRTLELVEDSNKTLKTYSVGVGQPKFPTPTGNFKIFRMVKNPEWQNPYKSLKGAKVKAGKGNPLGTRWMSFHSNNSGEFGIHGTNAPSSIGGFVSHGCIRMKSKEAEEIFKAVGEGTTVKVCYYTYKVSIIGRKIKVSKYPDLYRNKKLMKNYETQIQEQLNSLKSNYTINYAKYKEISHLKEGQVLTFGELTE